VRFEVKANHELEARIRQFEAFLRDLHKGQGAGMNYETAVEPRVMIAAIIDKLSITPYQLDRQIPSRVETMDRSLRQQWASGDFIWPKTWQPAYPQDDYWWLYGELT
jgi:hypothetical protein